MGMEQIEGRVAYLLHDAAFHPRARRAVRYAGQGMGTRAGLVQVRAHARLGVDVAVVVVGYGEYR